MMQEGSWAVSPQDCRGLGQGSALSPLESLSVIRASGADALGFFDRLFCSRISDIGEGAKLTGWADAQGRLIAAPRIVREAPESFLLLIPRGLAPAFLKKIRLYVFRSKVKFEEVTGSLCASGLAGGGAARALEAAGLSLPEKPWEVSRSGGLAAVRVPDADPGRVPALEAAFPRVIVLGEPGALPRLDAPKASEGLWWLADISCGLPTVFAATSGRFLPQAVGLEKLGGVSFNKGCYPGQEVIARLQNHPERLKRQPEILCSHEPLPGAGGECAGGTVVESVSAGEAFYALIEKQR